jgi:hypothetical protein
VLAAVPLLPSPQASSALTAPFCDIGQSPHFGFGFASLKDQIGDAMGDPIECEHANPENGDVLQQTSTGLSFYRKSTNTPTFTDGFLHWGLTADGLVTWTGREHRSTRSRRANAHGHALSATGDSDARAVINRAVRRRCPWPCGCLTGHRRRLAGLWHTLRAVSAATCGRAGDERPIPDRSWTT